MIKKLKCLWNEDKTEINLSLLPFNFGGICHPSVCYKTQYRGKKAFFFFCLSCNIFCFFWELEVPGSDVSVLAKIASITFRYRGLIQCMVSQPWSSYLVLDIKFPGIQGGLCLWSCSGPTSSAVWKRIKHIGASQEPSVCKPGPCYTQLSLVPHAKEGAKP